MRMKLPQYTKSDLAIMWFVVIPWIMIINRYIVGALYFNSVFIFIAATVITFTVTGLSWQVHTWIAVTLRERFPHEGQTSLRLLIAIPLFMLITSLVITLLFWGYDVFHFPGADFDAGNYRSALVSGAVVNVFVTFVHEGVARFEKWKAALIENEQLKKEYMQSQLLGLKSQMNPHFLFNSLNTLSSLINEDADKAEDFLNHMSKVYRYLLRNHEEQLVTVETELTFTRSYYYLLKARHADGLQVEINVDEESRRNFIPPLTLQMIIENTLNQNSVTKATPLHISIVSDGGWLEVHNRV
ncbi:MAG TPA: histidine kinase, partial [Niastella sp.]|nr:histidine kinase [Niastella sp.]